jgi:hypothetical protein
MTNLKLVMHMCFEWLRACEWISRILIMFDNYVVQDLLTFTEADIKDLGVKNSAHRARVVSSLVALRTKQGKGRLHGSSLLSFPLLHTSDFFSLWCVRY